MCTPYPNTHLSHGIYLVSHICNTSPSLPPSPPPSYTHTYAHLSHGIKLIIQIGHTLSPTPSLVLSLARPLSPSLFLLHTHTHTHTCRTQGQADNSNTPCSLTHTLCILFAFCFPRFLSLLHTRVHTPLAQD